MDVLAIFKDSPNARRIAAGERIFQAGDAATEMYVLLEGTVDIQLDGRQIEELHPGSVFGEMAIVDSTPRSADAVARTDVLVEPIDEEWFKHLIRRSPTFGLDVMSATAERLRRFMRPPNRPHDAAARRRPRGRRRLTVGPRSLNLPGGNVASSGRILAGMGGRAVVVVLVGALLAAAALVTRPWQRRDVPATGPAAGSAVATS